MAETLVQPGIERTVPSASLPGAAQRAAAFMGSLRERWTAMASGRRNGIIASVCLIAAVCAGLAWYASRPDWRTLFSGLEGRDVQQVAQELSAAGISYRTSADGASIEVPAELVDKARMEVAAKGMPQTGRLGFELFDKPNWVGSEFDERVNYQRALEGELEHTIDTLGAVRSARVHLVLPQPSLFTGSEKAAKASVVLHLKRASMPLEEADSIRSLVAGAVETLAPDQVTLIDADGRVNLKPHSTGGVEDVEAEAELESKLVAMLEPLAGRDNVRATVNLSYDQGTEERTDDIYDPAQSAPVTLQKSEQSSTAASRPSGVPGTASNTPAGSAQGAVQGSAAAAAPGTPPLLQKEPLPVYPQAAAQGQNLREESDTYAVTRHTLHTQEGPGRIWRVTAAVLVNDRMLSEGAGKQQHVVWKPRSGEEMHRLEELAQAAVGFDSRRGDQVVLQNISFTSNAPEPKPPVFERATEQLTNLLHAQPNLLHTAMLGVIGLLLVLFVVRPAVQQLMVSLREPMLLRSESPATLVPELESPSEEITPEAERIARLREQRNRGGTRDGMLEYVADSMRRDISHSTRLLEAWIGTSGENE